MEEGKMSSNIKEVQLPITGMTCAACAIRIEKGLKKQEGVQEASVNLALEKATIKYDPAETNVNNFIKKIDDLGYGVLSEKVEFDIIGMTCGHVRCELKKD